MEHNAINQINKADVIEKMWDTLNLCDIYHPTDTGMEAIYDEWARNNGTAEIWNGMSLLDILSKHPDYVPEKGYIVKKAEYDRPVNFELINEILHDIREASGEIIREEVKLEPFSLFEVENIKDTYDVLASKFRGFPDVSLVTYNGMTYKQIVAEQRRWSEKLADIYDMEDVNIQGSTIYTAESYNRWRRFRRLIDDLGTWIYNISRKCDNEDKICDSLIIDEKVVEYINNAYLNIRGIREGQTFNKVIGKILREMKFDTKWSDFHRQIPRLGDASCPQKYTRFTILSVNPVDYWRMSFGKKWASCMTLDKLGNFTPSSGGQHYNGMHCSGTESYMLDESTMIMYTVDEDYEGSDYEMQPKVYRCVFHVGVGKFVMGRVYPQGKDGAKDVYRQWRNIFQQIISECLNIPNYWKTEYDRYDKLNQISSTGTHYEDYECDYCDIAGWSWHKPFADAKPSTEKIRIGHDPICPSCGCEHDVEDNIECEDCNSAIFCEHCGEGINGNSRYYHDDNDEHVFCCIECANYEDYYLAEDGYEYTVYHEYDLYYEGSTCTYWRDDYYSVTIDDNWYHNEEAAEEDGWEKYDDEWYKQCDFEEDALTGERFPYSAMPYEFYEYEGNYFISEENMEEWKSENVDEEESEVA